MVKKTKSINEILIEMLMVNVGKISGIIEEKGEYIFGQKNLLTHDEITDYSVEFLELFITLLQSEHTQDRNSPEYRALRQYFTTTSQQIQIRGGSVEEFVRYIHFMQNIFISDLESESKLTLEEMREVIMLLATLFNDITLDVFQVYLEEKERTITAQQEEIRATSTPITEIWDGVLTLPIIGSLDSSRTMIVMEKLLGRIESERASTVVIDVTGVITIDSQVAHHLIQMIRAIRLMGAAPILTGIRPEIARALTNLNIDLGDVTTRATLSDGLKEAFKMLGISVCKN